MGARILGGRIRLVEKIASGGMGTVYRGTQLATDADVAVKVLDRTASVSPEDVERFRAEGRVASRLAHRNIVRVFDLIEEADGTVALVMELLAGRTLEGKLAAEGALEPEAAVAVGVAVLGALEHAHAVGIIHRDVKPANVFLAVEPDGRVVPKLLDFGVAKHEATTVKTLDGNVLGTSRYMSPEQVRGEALDGRSDLFAVAAVLYEAMTGTSPFAAPHPASSLAKVLEHTVDPDDRIPPRLWLVVQKALAKQAYARPATPRAFAGALVAATGKSEDELAAVLRDAPPPPPRLDRPALVARTSGAFGRHRVSVAVALAVVLGGLVTTRFLVAARGVPVAASPVTSTSTVPSGVEAPVAPEILPPPATVTAAPKQVARPRATTTTSVRTKAIATTPGF